MGSYVCRRKIRKFGIDNNCTDATNIRKMETMEVEASKQSTYNIPSINGYDFSHVSLGGFYRHIQLLTGLRTTSMFSQSLLKFGVNQETLERVFKIDIFYFYHTKVTKELFLNR